MLFPAFLRLREIDPDTHRPFLVGGGRVRLWLMTYVPMLLVILAVVFAVVPFSRAELSEKVPLLFGTVFAIAVGEIIAAGTDKRHSKRRASEGGSV